MAIAHETEGDVSESHSEPLNTMRVKVMQASLQQFEAKTRASAAKQLGDHDGTKDSKWNSRLKGEKQAI